jgi:hypothetical protein
MGTQLWGDIAAIAAALQGRHTVTPAVVMQLLHRYCTQGPFRFEPMQLRDEMNADHLGLRVNTLGLVGVEQELRVFFDEGEDGLWRPNTRFFREG